MKNQRQAALEYLRDNEAQFLAELAEFIRIPSISTDPERKADMERAVAWLSTKMRAIGMEHVQAYPTGGHPVVYGELRNAGAQAPTALVYGHYDVQPADPLELWSTPAFEATQRGDNLFARGATDMKGPILAVLKAVEALNKTGGLGLNLKFLFEGEEEIGSTNLQAFIEGHKELLACDFAINPDAGMLHSDLPTLTYALRGLAYFEINLSGPKQDLHSGIYGGAVHNPAQVLCELVAGMHDAQGRVTLPGFYDSVLELSAEERQELARLPVDDGFFLKQTGAPALWGEDGFTSIERVGGRPTLEVNGMLSGFTGEGQKTVLPAKAMAKISCRLVPNQDPAQVYAQLQQYLTERAPQTVRVELKLLSKSKPSISDRHSRWVQAMQAAMETVWGTRPVFRREGGSIPVIEQFQQFLGVEAVNFGSALPEDNMHAPNEKLHLPTWSRSMQAMVHFLCNLNSEEG